MLLYVLRQGGTLHALLHQAASAWMERAVEKEPLQHNVLSVHVLLWASRRAPYRILLAIATYNFSTAATHNSLLALKPIRDGAIRHCSRAQDEPGAP